MALIFPKPKRTLKRSGPTLLESRWMSKVAQLPCQICGRHPVDVHHCFCGRFSQARASHFDTIPLCDGHHQGRWDTSLLAIHQRKATWIEQYGMDYEYLPKVRELVFYMTNTTAADWRIEP